MGAVALSIILALGVIALFIRGDFHELKAHMLRADLIVVIFAVALYFIEVGFWTGRWQIALSAVDRKINFSSLYLICHGGKFVTNVTPIMKAGGDPFRAYFAKKLKNLPYDLGLATLLAETAISIPVFFSFLTAGLVIWLYLTAPLWLTFLVGILMGLFVVFFLPVVRWLVERETALDQLVRLVNWIREHLGRDGSAESVKKSLKEFYKSTQFVMNHKRAAVSMVLVTFFLYSTTVLRFYLIFLALGLTISWYVPLLGATVPFLLGLIPFSPGGLVFVEGGMLGLFVALGISGPAAASAVIIERGISYFISTAAGGVAASYLGLRIWKS